MIDQVLWTFGTNFYKKSFQQSNTNIKKNSIMSSLTTYSLAVSAAATIAAQCGYMWMVSAGAINRVDRVKRNADGVADSSPEPDGSTTEKPTERPGYKQGPHAIISDSLFSLVIFIYVAIVFCYMFYAFCWKEPPRPASDTDSKNIPMITSMLEEMEKEVSQEKLEKEEEKKSLEKKEKIEANGNGKSDDETTPL